MSGYSEGSSRRRRRASHSAEGEGSGSERWLVSYADFITLLFAFFVVMFAISQSDLKKFKEVSESVRRAFSGESTASGPGAGVAPVFQPRLRDDERVLPPSDPQTSNSDRAPEDTDEELREIRNLLQEAIELEESTSQPVSVEVQGRGDQAVLRWVIQDSYPPGRTEVARDFLPLLGRVARVLARFSARPVRLEGHADAAEAPAPAWQLGFERASWVGRFLTERGVKPEQVTLASRGTLAPVRKDGTHWAKARNRRVELLILPRLPPPKSP